jgi:hypothetical protein
VRNKSVVSNCKLDCVGVQGESACRSALEASCVIVHEGSSKIECDDMMKSISKLYVAI